MSSISETEFARICSGIAADRETIIKHNPIGPDAEVLLWMLLNCLNSYLSLDESEVPCFTTRPDSELYRQAIIFVLKDRMTEDFDAGAYMTVLINAREKS